MNTWHQDMTNCPGLDTSLNYCIIPMLTLQQAPFSYNLDDLIQVRVSAVNAQGTATDSAILTTGAKLRTVPYTMTDPFKGGQTTDLQIQVEWTGLTGTSRGNSDILSYNLYWDNGSGTTNLQLTDSLVTSYTILGVTGG